MKIDAPGDVGDALVRHLAEIGAPVCFGVPGGQTIPLYGAARRQGYRHILMHDERNAACAADAYARVTGRIGVCDATVGPGAANLVSGLAEAFASAVPVLAIVADAKTGREHLRHRGVASQSMEQRAFLEAVCKQVCRVHHPEGLADAVENAVRVAVTGRAGPVALEIPEDVFSAPAPDSARALSGDAARWPRFAADPTPEDALRAAEAIARAQRPVILAGGGAMASAHRAEIVKLAETAGIPIATSINGKGVIDEYHRYALGVVGVFGSVAASMTVRQADVVLVLGSKFAQFNSFLWRVPSGAQHIIHVDTDGAEIGRAIPAAQGICADAGLTALRIREALGGRKAVSWELSATVPPQPGTAPDDPHVAPEGVIAALNRSAGPEDILVSDASLASGWTAAGYRVRGAGRKFLAPRGLAGIGWAGGAAIGAAMAAPAGARVLCVAGDGAAAYWIGEVETAVRLALPITFLVLNNAGFGWIVQGERMLGIAPQSHFGGVDFAAMARAMGAGGAHVDRLGDLHAALEDASRSAGPTVIDVQSSNRASPSVDYALLDPTAASAYGAYGMG